mmetsp:Transcript_22227/g.53334  ORF Transcript_22227/g.53334 Transcript_22227/m.53334 type:complete len:295 (+) Transcript_22227:328-1212(+)
MSSISARSTACCISYPPSSFSSSRNRTSSSRTRISSISSRSISEATDRSSARDTSVPSRSRMMTNARRCLRCSWVRCTIGWYLMLASSPSRNLAASELRMPTTGSITEPPVCEESPGATSVSSLFTTIIATAPAEMTFLALSTNEDACPVDDPRCTTAILPLRASAFASSESAWIGSHRQTVACTSSQSPKEARINSTSPCIVPMPSRCSRPASASSLIGHCMSEALSCTAWRASVRFTICLLGASTGQTLVRLTTEPARSGRCWKARVGAPRGWCGTWVTPIWSELSSKAATA